MSEEPCKKKLKRSLEEMEESDNKKEKSNSLPLHVINPQGSGKSLSFEENVVGMILSFAGNIIHTYNIYIFESRHVTYRGGNTNVIFIGAFYDFKQALVATAKVNTAFYL